MNADEFLKNAHAITAMAPTAEEAARAMYDYANSPEGQREYLFFKLALAIHGTPEQIRAVTGRPPRPWYVRWWHTLKGML